MNTEEVLKKKSRRYVGFVCEMFRNLILDKSVPVKGEVLVRAPWVS